MISSVAISSVCFGGIFVDDLHYNKKLFTEPFCRAVNGIEISLTD
jgi:hypothetical protein